MDYKHGSEAQSNLARDKVGGSIVKVPWITSTGRRPGYGTAFGSIDCSFGSEYARVEILNWSMRIHTNCIVWQYDYSTGGSPIAKLPRSFVNDEPKEMSRKWEANLCRLGGLSFS